MKISRYLTKKEIIILGISTILMSLCFCFVEDLRHTVECSLAFLEGHFSDFYDYNIYDKGMPTIVYYPTIYLIYAIWNIPLKLLGIQTISKNAPAIMFYEKLLGFLFLALLYYFVYKLSLLILKEKKKALNSLFVLFTLPIFFLYEFPWELYDSVWCAFLIMGIYFLLKNTKNTTLIAIVCFAICTTCKTFVLFVILPILFYRFKNILHLALAGIGCLSLYGLQTILFSNSEYFVNNVISPLDGGFFINAVWGMSIQNISILLVIFILICIHAYRNDNNNIMFYIYYPFISGAIFYGIAQETPNWIYIFIPFYAILISNLGKKDRTFFYLLNMVLSIACLGFVMSTRGFAYGESTFGAGMLGRLLFGVSNAYDTVLVHSEQFFTKLLYRADYTKYFDTVIFSVLLYAIYYLNPSNIQKKEIVLTDSQFIEKDERKIAYICLGIPIMFYLLPVLAWVAQNQTLFG